VSDGTMLDDGRPSVYGAAMATVQFSCCNPLVSASSIADPGDLAVSILYLPIPTRSLHVPFPCHTLYMVLDLGMT